MRRLRFFVDEERAVLYGSSPAVCFESAWPMTKSDLTRVLTGLGWKRAKPWVKIQNGWETFYSRR